MNSAIDVSAVGRLVTAAASSQGVETTDSKTGDYILGYLTGGDAADNEIAEMEITLQHAPAAVTA